MRVCGRCKAEKSTDEFFRHSGRKDGLQFWCKPCASEARMEGHRRSKYGLSNEQVRALYASGCAACGDAADVIDHDHASGRVRDSLCGACNRALGHAKEDPARLRALAEYAEVWRA